MLDPIIHFSPNLLFLFLVFSLWTHISYLIIHLSPNLLFLFLVFSLWTYISYLIIHLSPNLLFLGLLRHGPSCKLVLLPRLWRFWSPGNRRRPIRAHSSSSRMVEQVHWIHILWADNFGAEIVDDPYGLIPAKASSYRFTLLLLLLGLHMSRLKYELIFFLLTKEN